MFQTPLDRHQAELLATIGQYLHTSGMHVYAAMDGAFHADIAQKLKAANLLYRPLYLSAAQPEIVLGGPFIVNAHQAPVSGEALSQRLQSAPYKDLPPDQVSQRLATEMIDALKAGDPRGGGLLPVDDYQDQNAALQRVEAIIRIAGPSSGLVFWFGDARLTWESFYRHLRGLNKILVRKMPAATAQHAIADAAGDDIATDEPGKYQSLVFRHADANVLTQVLYVWEPDKLDRFLGPAHSVFYRPNGIWGNKIETVQRRAYTPTMHRGPLFLTRSDMDAITQRRCVAYDRKFARLLKPECEQRQFIYESDLLKKVSVYREYATRNYGLVSEQDVYEFVAIAVLYEKTARRDAWLHHTLMRSDLNNREKMRLLRERYRINDAEG